MALTVSYSSYQYEHYTQGGFKVNEADIIYSPGIAPDQAVPCLCGTKIIFGTSNVFTPASDPTMHSIYALTKLYSDAYGTLEYAETGTVDEQSIQVNTAEYEGTTYYYSYVTYGQVDSTGTASLSLGRKPTDFYEYPEIPSTPNQRVYKYTLPYFEEEHLAAALVYADTGEGTPDEIWTPPSDDDDAFSNIPASSTSDASSGDYQGTNDVIDVPGIPNILPCNTGVVRVYSMTTDELSSLADILWSDDFLDNFKKLFNEPMDSVISLNMVEVFSDISTTAGLIKIGNYETNINSHRVQNNYVDDDFGTVDCSGHTASFMDFNPHTQISLYLPTVGMVSIDPDFVIGHTLQCKRRTDIMTGATVVYLINDLGNIYSFAGNGAFQIPLSGSNYNTLISNIMHSVGGAVMGGVTGGVAGAAMGAAAGTLGTLTNSKTQVSIGGNMSAGTFTMSLGYPFLIGKYPRVCRPSNQEHYTGYPSLVTNYISKFSGYLKVKEVYLTSKTATQNELEEIEQLLKEGVYI